MVLHIATHFIVFLAVVAVGWCALSPISASTDKLIVSIDSGIIEGMRISVPSSSDSSADTEVLAWLSIPFAEPPTGSRRWKQSEPVRAWNGTLKCTAMRPSCIPSGAIEGIEYSEDCLHLSVYTLADPSDPGPYPVLYYIFGGALLFGSGTEDLLPFMAHAGNGKGVVVVEVNYRLNILGFLATKELSKEQGGSSGNYGFSDQLLGLEWVQKNIARFGGDPNSVTIAGQSSGGTSVFALMSSPRSKSLFHRAISLSGSPNISMSIAQAEQQNADIVTSSGCKPISGNDEAVLTCLRNLSADAVVSLTPASWHTPGIWDLPHSYHGQNYAGLAIVDGSIVTKPFDEALASGVIDVPFMMGNMQFEPDEFPEKDVSALSDQQWREFLSESFTNFYNDSELITKNNKNSSTIADAIYQLYLPFSRENPQKAFDAIVADYGVYCPSIALARKIKSSSSLFKSNLYLYVNKWNLSSPLVNENMYQVRYAFHYLDFIMIKEDWNLYTYNNSSDLNQILSNESRRARSSLTKSSLESATKFVPQESDLAGSRFLQSIWFEFMQSGQVDQSSDHKWQSVEAITGWPEAYNMFVIDPKGSESITSYRAEFCAFFSHIGMDDKSFWWVN